MFLSVKATVLELFTNTVLLWMKHTELIEAYVTVLNWTSMLLRNHVAISKLHWDTFYFECLRQFCD